MSLVLTDVSEGIGTLTLNAPDTRNTMTLPMVDEICAAVDAFEADETCSAIIVTGAGSAFCAGADLGNLQTATAESLGKIYEGFLRISRSSLPTIAAVNGAAVGAGMNLALGCDVRIAAQRAKFDTRFLQIGLHPGGGHTWMQRRNGGVQTAMATVVCSEVLDGPEAERLGLAHRCVADELLISAARALAAGAASAPRELVMITKRTIAEMADVDTHDAAVAKELDPQVWTARQPWFEERIAALKAKISSKS
ncbi:MAG: enoyl-CoA hydratase-related protein [Ilumatobacteraceae bacterium]